MIDAFTIDLSQIMSIADEVNEIARVETQQARATESLNDKSVRPMPLREAVSQGRISRPPTTRALSKSMENKS